MGRSGDGWTTCGRGHRHWGLFGAAGVLVRSGSDVLLQLRADWIHHGGTWGIPGGARDEDETLVQAALRELAEETTVDPAALRPEWTRVDDHGGWFYAVIGTSVREAARIVPAPANAESTAVRWFDPAEVDGLDLHTGFADSWPALRPLGAAPHLVVDAANVIGSRPDGWWRDRAGAVTRLRDELADADALALPGDPTVRWRPAVTLVTEGAARQVPGVAGVEVVPAPGPGDDTILATAARLAGGSRPVLVVTADRELRRRVEAVGASVLGPRTLLDALPSPTCQTWRRP